MKTTRRSLVAGGSALAAAAVLGTGIPSVAAQETTTITWWHITTEGLLRDEMQARADAFVAEHPDVKIEITVLENEAFKSKLTTNMQSGDPPHVFQSWGGGVLAEYAGAGLMRDITADLAVDGWGESFGQAGLALYSHEGKNYGVPWNLGCVGFWYRKALFAQAGIEAPPTTWTEFLEVVQTLKDAGITPISVGEGDKWPGHFYWVYLAIRNGGQAGFDAAYTRTGSFTDAPFVKAGADLQQLIDLEPFQTDHLATTYPDAELLFGNSEAAIELMGHWAPTNISNDQEDPIAFRADLGWFPFPVVEGGAGDPSDVLGGGNGFGLGKDAPDAAVEFVRYLTSVEVQSAWAAAGWAVPPTVTAANAAVTDENLAPVIEALGNAKYFQLYYDQFLPPAVGGVVNDEVQGIFAGTQTPEGVAEAIEESFASELDS